MNEHIPTEQQPGGIRTHLLVLAIFLIASVVMTWPLARDLDSTLLSWGDPVFQSWTLAWAWHGLTTDPASIFDANVFYPWHNTLAYADHLFGQALTVLPVLALTENGILADNIATLLALALSGFAMYLLVVDLTGNRLAGLLAGLAFAFAPARMARLEHLNILSAQWLPLLLLCLRRALLRPTPRPVHSPAPVGEPLESTVLLPPLATPQPTGGQRVPWLLALAACFLAQGLSGVYFLYFSILMLLVAGGVWAAFALRDRDWWVLRQLALAGLACGIAGLLLVPTLMPYLRVRDELRVERSAAEVDFWSAKITDYLAISPRNRAWNETLGRYHQHIERDLFPGVFLLALAGIGLTHRQAGRSRWVLVAVTLAGFGLSFGRTIDIAGVEVPTPYQLFYDWLPGFRAIRVPARLGLVALVGLAGLAGLGVDRLWRLGRDELRFIPWVPHWIAQSPRMLGGVALVSGMALLFAETLTRMELPPPLPASPDEVLPAYAWMRENPAPTIELPMGEGPVASAWPNFFSTFHWNPVVNGFSGVLPPTYEPLRERMRAFPRDDTLWLLQGIGVESIVIHAEMPAAQRAAVEREIARQPELQLVFPGRDAVYRLERDPWMWRLAEAVPAGAGVDLPAAEQDPLAFGLLMAILQRTGHEVTGEGALGSFTFPEAETRRCWIILPEDAPPAQFGYGGAQVIRREPGMVLYRAAGCE